MRRWGLTPPSHHPLTLLSQIGHEGIAEALVSTLGALDRRIADLDFPSFSTEDRERVVETLTALKDTLDEALDRAAQGGKVLA